MLMLGGQSELRSSLTVGFSRGAAESGGPLISCRDARPTFWSRLSATAARFNPVEEAEEVERRETRQPEGAFHLGSKDRKRLLQSTDPSLDSGSSRVCARVHKQLY